MAEYSRNRLAGMTTNERLMVVGLMDKFEDAIGRLDLEQMRKILESIYVDEPSIARILADAAESRS